MSTLIVIPARLGSTRLPNKPLRELGGRPLVVRVMERVATLGLGAEIVVATDDERIASAVRDAGGAAVMTSRSHPSGTDRVAEVARQPTFAGRDIIVNVQGDEPFITAEAFHAAIGPVTAGIAPLGTAAVPDDASILSMPSIVKVVRDAAGRALYFSRAPIPFQRDVSAASGPETLILRHIGIYAYRPDALQEWVRLPPSPLERIEHLEQLRPLAAGIPIGVGICADAPGAGIDTEEDLRRANAAWPANPLIASSPSPAGIR